MAIHTLQLHNVVLIVTYQPLISFRYNGMATKCNTDRHTHGIELTIPTVFSRLQNTLNEPTRVWMAGIWFWASSKQRCVNFCNTDGILVVLLLSASWCL